MSGQPVAYPPSHSKQQLHHHAVSSGSVYINKSYDSGHSKERGARRVPDQELIVIDYADTGRDATSSVVRDPVQLVDFNSGEEVSMMSVD